MVAEYAAPSVPSASVVAGSEIVGGAMVRV